MNAPIATGMHCRKPCGLFHYTLRRTTLLYATVWHKTAFFLLVTPLHDEEPEALLTDFAAVKTRYLSYSPCAVHALIHHPHPFQPIASTYVEARYLGKMEQQCHNDMQGPSTLLTFYAHTQISPRLPCRSCSTKDCINTSRS